MTAVQIQGAGRFAVTGIQGRLRANIWTCVQPDTVAGVSVMLVVVVTEMRHRGLCLMPAVRRHRRPAELERQEGEQDDGEDAMHGRESSGYRVFSAFLGISRLFLGAFLGALQASTPLV